MAGVIGDITISAGSPGHVGMFISPTEIMHAQSDTGVHVEGLVKNVTSTNGSTATYYFTNFAYRPPWEKLTEKEAALYQAAIVTVSNRMKDRVPYGYLRMIRLFVGDSAFGDGAKERLKKYWERLQGIRGDENTKLVTKVTCVEAVVLTYQLAFYQHRVRPFFIELDAAHTMPHTLEKWLLANQWSRVYV
jgi:hypothetical protein